MTSMVTHEYQHYRAPQQNQTALVAPGVAELVSILTRSSGEANSAALEFCGKPLEVARQQAREEVIDLAVKFTSAYREVPELASSPSTRAPANSNRESGPGSRWSSPAIVMSGHQPELFHAGVWFKNFLLSHLAKESGAIAINFLVDNDVCRNAAIRVPGYGPHGSIVAQSIPFDAQRDSVPWELRRLNSPEMWESFPRRVTQSLLPGSPTPLLAEMWPAAVEAVRSSDRLGLAIAQARHRLEEQLGLETLEVPSSTLVRTRAFARFSIQLLSELPRFQDVYNSQLALYRAAHRIRNHAHPVPALEQADGWLEAPWWIYRQSAPKRQRMWVRLLNNQLFISDLSGWQAVIEGRLDCDNAASQWMDLQSDGVCIRPRALLTTMYLRMFVSDLFVHGIGGGKYDQLTDAIMSDFFEMQPPPMAIATATMRLPVADALNETGSSRETENQIREQRDHVWRMKFHADELAQQLPAEAQRLLAKKQELLAHIPERGEKWEWHREISAVNKRLSELAAPRLDESRAAIERLTALERQQRVLESREVSFCLFPRETIAATLTKLSR